MQREVEHWSLTTLREKLVKIGAKVVRHGRYVTFQMAEVAIPRALFADILRTISLADRISHTNPAARISRGANGSPPPRPIRKGCGRPAQPT